MKNLLIAPFIFFTVLCFAQTKNRVISIPVIKEGKRMYAPWTGGMNAPQFSPCDLDRDGVDDLFVFDRVGNKVLTYLNLNNSSDTTFMYAPQYEEIFPKLDSWALIRDYNMDGIPDIFAHVNTGVWVAKGRLENNVLRFDTVSPILQYHDDPYLVNLYVGITDIPVVTDVNRDGDLDVLTFGVVGSAVEYYENQTKEKQGDPHYVVDSLQYNFITPCWGDFYENSFTNGIQLNITCKGGGHELANDGSRHAGSAIYNFDDGNDGDVDLLLGDISFSNLVFTENCGDSSYAHMCHWDSLFPSCDVPVRLPIFPAAFGIDANNDGLEDLLIAPNERKGIRDTKNVMYYKNVNNQLCNFTYQTDSFLVYHSIDLGGESNAQFFDFNGDGLKDIVAGNYGYANPGQNSESKIAVYLNTGTQTKPEYTLSTFDYASLSTYNFLGMYPAFGDLDGDGKADMVLGEERGYLHFLKNVGASQAVFPSVTTQFYFNLDIGTFSTPFIYDVNGDSLNDLIVGGKNGRLNYFWNFGTKTNPQFHMDSVNIDFGGVRVNEGGSIDGYSAPFITRDANNNMVLFVGSLGGKVYQYIINPANLLSGSFQMVTTDYIGQDVGAKSTIGIADINNDGKWEYIVGNARGGLMLYSDAVWDPSTSLNVEALPLDNGLRVYPNPANDYFICALTEGSFQQPVVEMFNVIGEKVKFESSTSKNQIQISTAHLAKGVYFVRISDAGVSYTRKVLIK